MTCQFCHGALGLLREAVDAGLRFTPEEVRTLVAKAESDIEEITVTLAARGFVQFPSGNWGWLNPNEIQ